MSHLSLHKFSLLSSAEKRYLASVVSDLPNRSVCVESGTYFGGGTAIIAEANPNVEVHSFDPYDDFPYSPLHHAFLKVLGDPPNRSIDVVKKHLAGYPTIHLHHVLDKVNWTSAVDLYFEDGCHKDPELKDNLDHWLPKVRIGGTALFHDYRPLLPRSHRYRFPDVEAHVERLLSSGEWVYHNSVEALIGLKRTV